MRMLRHLLTSAAISTVALTGVSVRAGEFANPYALLPRCPDDPGATQAMPLNQTLSAEDLFHGDFGPGVTRDSDGNIHVPNGAAIRQGEHELKAEQLDLDWLQRRIDVRGKVRYSNSRLIIEGDTGSFSEGEAEFEGAQFELPQQPAHGSARSLSLNKDGILRLESVEYTTCPKGRPAWQIKADSFSIDTNKSIATARDPRVEFFGVPILRLPYITLPVGNVRKSGLLFPGIGYSTNSGVQLSVPYYFNIAPNQDLLVTPTWHTSRGLDFEGNYRFLTRSTRGEILGNVLPNDRKTDNSRTRIRIDSQTQLPRGWRLSLDAERVSDSRYYEDFSAGGDGASIAFLPRRAQLSYRDDHLDAGVIVRDYQILDQDLPDADQPHTELPRLYLRGNWLTPGALPLSYGVDSELVLFQHDSAIEGWRFDTTPQIGIDYEGAGYFLKPRIALETTHYRLHGAATGVDRTPSRTLPVLSIDSGLLFERDSGRRGQRRMTLEPRLMYLYAPYREQSALPLFDTAEPDLNWVELFRTNRYTGIDRISDANQITAGFTTQLFSNQTGQRFLTTTVGQAFYFRSPRVRLPDEPVSGHSSDLIAQAELQAFKHWTVSSGLQWNPQDSRTEKAELALRYQTEPRSVLNLGYRYQRDRLEQMEFSAAWPVTDQWRLYGRSVYSLRDDKAIENFAGFEFSSCCWNLRAVARDYVSRRSGERDRSYFLQLELKGLSNVGLAADAFLERAIRGYSTGRQRR